MRQIISRLIPLMLLFMAACSGKPEQPSSVAPPTSNLPQTPAATTTSPNFVGTQAAELTPTQYPPAATPQPLWTETPIQAIDLTPPITSWFDPNPPISAVDAYRLRNWSESTIQELLQQAFERKITNSLGDEYYAHIFQYEWLLRYPQSTAWVNGPWRLTILSPIELPFSNSNEMKSVFVYIVETEANAVQGDPEQIAAKLRLHGFYVEEPILVNNLFGVGENGVIFEATVDYLYSTSISASQTILFALRSTPAGYQFVTILDWFATKYEYPEVEVHQDENRNSYPEIYLYFRGGWSNFPKHCWGDLSIYEWDGQVFARRLYHATVLQSNDFASNCQGSWQFQAATDATTPELITSEFRYIFPGCPDLEIQRTFQWDGLQYQLTSTDYLPIETDQLECQVNWADTVIYYAEDGWQRDTEIRYLENLLSRWDANADEKMGPASHDYFMFRLALWHDLRNEQDMALSLLQTLVENPVSSKYDLPSRLGAAYLDGRQQLGVLGACIRVENLWEDEINKANLDGYGLNATNIVNALGFWVPRWEALIERFCDPNEIATQLMLLNDFNIESELPTRLENVGAEVHALQSGDINQDGREDQLVILDLVPGSALWAFLNLPEGIKAIEITSVPQEPDTLPPQEFSWQTFSLPSDASLAHIVWVQGRLVIFSITDDAAEVLFADWEVISYQLSSDAQLVDMTIRTSDGIIQTDQAVWDPEGMDYDVKPERVTETWKAVDMAERLIFQQRDYLAASQYIVSVFDEWKMASIEPNPDQISWESCLVYLLGLAYEMQGQSNQAIIAYYQAWSDYPGSMFGLAASAKLELMQP